MKKLILFLILTASCFWEVKAQTTFDCSLGVPTGYDYIGNDVLQLEDCNYLVLGQSYPDETIVQKVDEFGNLIWSKSYKLPSSIFYGKSMIQLPNGNIVIVGSGLTILSIDKNGNYLWSKKYNNFGSTPTVFLTPGPSGDLLIAGETSNTLEPYITKIDQNGGFIWHKTYSTTIGKINDITQTSSGKIAVVGQYNGAFSINGIYLLITDLNGNSPVDFSYSENTQNIEGSAIIESNDGNLLVTGSTGDINTMASFLIKLSPTGVILGSNGKKYTPTTTNSRLIAKDLIENASNNVTIVGSSDFKTFILETDVNFNFNGSNNHTINHINNDTKFINTFDGGHAIVCSRYGNPNLAHPNDYIRLIKTDANGGLNGCEVNKTYNQTNFNPITFSLSSTANMMTYSPIDAGITCDDIILDEDITCVSGVPICNYTGIDLSETYSCKVDLTNDDSSLDRAFDQVIMPNGNRMIAGVSYTNFSSPNIFLKELDAVGNLVRLNAYPIQGNISNLEMVYDEDANEFVLFFDANFGGSIDIYLLRVNATTLNAILKHGPLMSNVADSFSWEYAIEILYEPPSVMYSSGSYVLLANRQIPLIRKSYIVTIDKLNFNNSSVEELEINGSSENIKAFDIIKNPFTVPSGGCGGPEYVLTGSYNNDAFISNYCSLGLFNTTFDIDNNPSTTDIGKKITVAGNSYFVAGETTSGTSSNPNGNTWLADISFVTTSPSHQLNGVTIYDENNSKPESLEDLDYNGGYLYLTGKYNIGIVGPTGIDPNLNYISKLDLNRNRIWDNEYLDSYNQGSKTITDIEVDNGAINGIGFLYETLQTPSGSSLDYDIYVNKTDLNGALTDMTCVNPFTFTSTIVNPTINFYDDVVNTFSENVVDNSVPEVQLGFNKECCSDSMTPANPANCLIFDRTLISLASASSSILNSINTQDFTFEAWISGNEANQDTYPVIFSNRNGTTGAIFGLHAAWPSTGTFKLLMVQFGQQNYFIVGNGTYNQSLLDGDCHHVAITRAGNILTFFIDGQIIGTRTVPSTVNLDLSSNVNLTMGYDFVNPNSFNGSISDIRIWDTAKSASDIQSNMLFQLSGTEPNLVANWLMKEGTGQVLNDNSINGNNAILGNNANIEGIDPIWDTNCCQLPWVPCYPVIDLGTSTIPSGTIHAQNEVFSAGTIPAGTNVSLKAGQCIRLDSGFSSDAAADLEIIIEDCEPDVPD